jgi:hypothetical protein
MNHFHHSGGCCHGHGEMGHHQGGHCGHSGYPGRRFFSQEEKIQYIEEYLKQLQAEAKGVEEYISKLKAGK